MIVDIDNNKDSLEILLEAKEEQFDDISAKVREAILKLSKELRTMYHEGLINDVKVTILKPNTIPRNSKTGKISLIKDKRI